MYRRKIGGTPLLTGYPFEGLSLEPFEAVYY